MVSHGSDDCSSSSGSASLSCQSDCIFTPLPPHAEMGARTGDACGRPLQGDLHHGQVCFPSGLFHTSEMLSDVIAFRGVATRQAWLLYLNIPVFFPRSDHI